MHLRDALAGLDPNLYTPSCVWPAIVDLQLAMATEADHPLHDVALAHPTLSSHGQHERRYASHHPDDSKR
jgi:hypothetical protein